jgi:predicted helicase
MVNSIAYEKLVLEIYQVIQQVECLDTVKLLHNQRIEGKSGLRHQIDIYWELNIDGKVSRIAIECKHYSKRVSIGNVRDFFGVLTDVGNIRGILVTRVGFQSGAVAFAEHYGIELKEIRFHQEQDWHGRLKDVALEMSAYKPIILQRRITPDTRWLVQEQKVNRKPSFSRVQFH